MADDLGYTPGTGAEVATDDVGGRHFQLIKLDVGAGGATSPVVGSVPVSGETAADEPLTVAPVTIGALASSTTPAAVGEGDVVNLWATTNGALKVEMFGTVAILGGGYATSTGTTVTTVADTASSTTLLSFNSVRMGASITNDSSARLYIKCGTTASTTSYTVSLGQHDYWEVPAGYYGRIDGIWASDPGDGAARITEYTND